ncbi:MAG: helix-turn-helix domain-containing protein [Phycisphaera sp.]|nr:MAG: helix-turn-helix domain-containing protein [Phycisphaera sp.]
MADRQDAIYDHASFEDEVRKTIGRRLREVRQSHWITRAQLAKCVGVSRQTIHRYESGQSRIAAERLVLLAVTLGEPVERFLPELGLACN